MIYVRLTNIYVEEYIVEPFALVLIYRLSFTLMQTWQHQKALLFWSSKISTQFYTNIQLQRHYTILKTIMYVYVWQASEVNNTLGVMKYTYIHCSINIRPAVWTLWVGVSFNDELVFIHIRLNVMRSNRHHLFD